MGLLVGLSGCATVGWYGQAVRGQMEILTQREDIEQLLADPDTPKDKRRALALALEIRQFASDTLALPDNRSYTQYVDLGREAVVWNVVAVPAFDLQPKRWCYPIVGCLSYRGYFRQDRAQALAESLAAQGYDTAVFPVPAYSTLGRFADPVLNTMLGWDDARLAGLIFHELAHQRLFVRGDTDFNESYATFVEIAGIERWLDQRSDQEALRQWRQSQVIAQAFTELLLATRQDLIETYRLELEQATMESRKAETFAALQKRYHRFRQAHGDQRYDAWMNRDLNNAHLAMVATYQAGVDAFAALFEKTDRDFATFHRIADCIGRQPESTRDGFLASARIPDECGLGGLTP